ncbi:MFS transporter [Streptomyces sp. NPDC048516]|uniref:MFS transporter n=1 Tax=Streptomyces sp. NPDC048516 TaxID=3365565 RepID=UPI00371B9B43
MNRDDTQRTLPGAGRASTRSATSLPARDWVVLVLTCTAQFMCVLDDTIVNVALPAIQSHLGVRGMTLPWVVNGYLVTFGGLLLLAGRAADLFVRRNVFLTGLAVFGAASLGCGLAASPAMLITARAVQGVGAALMSAAALTILSVTFTGSERHRAFGVWGALSGTAGVLGMLLGGTLTTWLSWRWVFLINVPIVLTVVALSPRAIPAARTRERRPLDIPGAITGTGGIALLTFTVVNVEQAGWASPATLGCLAGVVALLILFVLVEARHRVPLLPLHVFRRRNVVGGVVCGMLLASAMLALFFFLTLYLQQVLGYSAFQTGLAYLPMSGMVILVAGAVAPQLVSRFGVRRVLAAGFALLATSLMWFAQIDVDTHYLPNLLVPALIAGAGLGATLVGVVTTIMQALSGEEEAGLASGLVSTTQQLGGALGIASLSAVAFAQVDGGTAETPISASDSARALIEGFQPAFYAAAGLTLAGIAVALLTTTSDTARRR